MEIILLKDVEKLGKRGEVHSVRDGFARNYLFPRTFALPATPENRLVIEAEKKRLSRRRVKERGEAEALGEKLRALPIRIEVVVGEKEKLFGAVTAQDVAGALAHEGVSVEKKQIRFAEPIRCLGTHEVTIELEAGVTVLLKVEVVRKNPPPKS